VRRVAILFLLTAGFCEAAAGSAELLIEPPALRANLGRKKLVLLDVRSLAACRAGYIPGALHADHAESKKLAAAPHAFEDAAGWSKRIGGLGISNDKRVVIYDADTSKMAARIWFLLNYWSVKDVRVLNGGLKAWQAEGFPIETKAAVAVEIPFKAVARPTIRITEAKLCRIVGSPRVQLIDTRSEAEYKGTLKLAKRGGHIPGAIHLEWTRCIDETGRFKPVDELKSIFAAAWLKPDKPVTTYCQSGGRASHVLFALKLAGFKNAQNYYASWQEWGNDKAAPIK